MTATCLANVAAATAIPAAVGFRRSANSIDAVMSGSMNTSKFAGWLSSSTSPPLATR